MTIALDVKLRVIELRKQGYTYAAITEMTGVVGTYKICKEAGLIGMGHGHRGRKSKHTEKEKQIVLNLREEGHTFAAISKITGMKMHNITNYCAKAGVKPKPRHSEEEKQKVINLRKEGYVCRAISEMTDIKIHDVRIICNNADDIKKTYGHLGRKKSINPFDARNKKIRELREQGLTLKEIGGMYEITRERVRQLCMGIDPPDLRARSNCCICGVEFVGYQAKYCCGECRKKGQVELHRQKNAKFSKYATVELVCAGCGVEFKRTNRLEGIAECGRISKGKKDSGRRFCSRECYYKKAFGR